MIEIRDLTKIYSRNSRPAVNAMSFTVNNGEIMGFAGLNGAGKTTTIRIATGIIYPTSGTVLIDGNDIVRDKVNASRLSGWVPEFPNFEPNARPLTLMRYYGGFYGMKAADATRRGRELLEAVSLEESMNEKLRNYSQGMKKRFSLAAAMLNDPQNYFFDETLNGLDPEGIRFMRKLMVELRGKGKAVLLSSHILNELETVADRIAIIHKGKLMQIMDRPLIEKAVRENGNLEEYFFKVVGG